MKKHNFKFKFDEIYRVKDTMTPMLIYRELEKFNKEKAPFEHADILGLNFVLRTIESGKIRGGLLADMYNWHIVNLYTLWVMKPYRHKGYGTQLLKALEEEAKKEHAHLIHTETFDWQAKDFYIKNGYEVFGVLDDCPKGHKRYYLKKNI